MFKYISRIIAQFSAPQKIIALSMLLFSIIVVSIFPTLISSITLDNDELNNKIEKQESKIRILENNIDSLVFKIRTNEKECTNQIIDREEEFLEMLDRLKSDLKFNNKIREEKIIRLNSTINESKIKIVENTDSLMPVTAIPERVNKRNIIVYDKPNINSTILMIDEMKKKIKKY